MASTSEIKTTICYQPNLFNIALYNPELSPAAYKTKNILVQDIRNNKIKTENVGGKKIHWVEINLRELFPKFSSEQLFDIYNELLKSTVKIRSIDPSSHRVIVDEFQILTGKRYYDDTKGIFGVHINECFFSYVRDDINGIYPYCIETANALEKTFHIRLYENLCSLAGYKRSFVVSYEDCEDIFGQDGSRKDSILRSVITLCKNINERPEQYFQINLDDIESYFVGEKDAGTRRAPHSHIRIPFKVTNDLAQKKVNKRYVELYRNLRGTLVWFDICASKVLPNGNKICTDEQFLNTLFEYLCLYNDALDKAVSCCTNYYKLASKGKISKKEAVNKIVATFKKQWSIDLLNPQSIALPKNVEYRELSTLEIPVYKEKVNKKEKPSQEEPSQEDGLKSPEPRKETLQSVTWDGSKESFSRIFSKDMGYESPDLLWDYINKEKHDLFVRLYMEAREAYIEETPIGDIRIFRNRIKDMILENFGLRLAKENI